ncbi:MAG: hypothetical protein M3Q99_09895, partial [Acidobacteriota bacterium]|nr:hypothetical protein [Acidobacteriota bacterium]
IPAGTGMKYYRNVKIADDATVNRKEEDEFDELADIRGGIDLPVFAIPGVKAEDTDKGYDEAEEKLDDISLETEEVFDESADLVIDEVDDDF